MIDKLSSFLPYFMCFFLGSILTCSYLGFKIQRIFYDKENKRLNELNRMKSLYCESLHNKQLNQSLKQTFDDFKLFLNTEDGSAFLIEMMYLWSELQETKGGETHEVARSESAAE